MLYGILEPHDALTKMACVRNILWAMFCSNCNNALRHATSSRIWRLSDEIKLLSIEGESLLCPSFELQIFVKVAKRAFVKEMQLRKHNGNHIAQE